MWNLEEAHQAFTAPKVCPSKSDDTAERFRQEGNCLYKKHMFDFALEHYNLSILCAHHPNIDSSSTEPAGQNCRSSGSEADMKMYKTLGYGYANRSAVQLVRKEYERCIADIDLAIKYGYPEELRSKLEERREKCLKAIKKAKRKNAAQKIIYLNKKIPPQLPKPNPSVPSFSDSIKVSYSATKGRHVVAARDIRPGDLIAVEKSYCSHNYSDEKGYYCPVCLMECHNLVPCPTCCKVAFCSDECRAEGLKIHMKECNILQAFDEMDLSDNHAALALKCVIQASFIKLKEILPKLNSENLALSPENLGFDDNGKFDSADYRSVYHVVSTKNLKSPDAINQACIVAFVLTKILHLSEKFFITEEGIPIIPRYEDFILTGTALMHHMAYRSAIFTFSDIKVINHGLSTQKTLAGQGMFPALSLMRHSCNAPTVYYNYGCVKIVRAFMPIAAGEEVTLALADRFITTPLENRKLQLKAISYECSCEACLGAWPTADFIPDEIHWKCIQCYKPISGTETSPICTECEICYNKTHAREWLTMKKKLSQAITQIQSLMSKFQNEYKVNRSDANAMHNATELLTKHVQQPAKIFTVIRDVYLLLFYSDL
ncbi:hypothetical protein SK128_000849 [Halocaridina rubra]|uniref:SET domain-containing protein n=1 Tax=Halocaridina rubra TaxID=373956 RepID=A0AAN9AHJ0_HALRR